uniref:Diguanylate cyclase A n=2 Tax=Tieghemostelium lacteum TaxID=361077 RepID=J3SGQ6_TIELA|nr:diguanylate cyclase A [Tieghemostelium lacteum]
MESKSISDIVILLFSYLKSNNNYNINNINSISTFNETNNMISELIYQPTAINGANNTFDQYQSYYTQQRIRDLIFALMFVIFIIYNLYKRENSNSMVHTFKKILNFTPTLIILEINFKLNMVKTANPIDIDQSFEYININSNSSQHRNLIPFEQFCEYLQLNASQLSQIIRQSPEQSDRTFKGLIVKGQGDKKYRITGKFDEKSLVFCGVILDISEEKSELKKMKKMASRDALTGLYNRNMLNQKIQKFCSQSQSDLCSINFLDLNDFKQINDNYGHEVGDQVLKHLSSQFLLNNMDGSILPIRLSGDEFLIVKRGVESVDQANTFINEYISKISSVPFQLSSSEQQKTNLLLKLSFGGVAFKKSSSSFSESDISAMINTADSKMYEMKKTKLNTYQCNINTVTLYQC